MQCQACAADTRNKALEEGDSWDGENWIVELDQVVEPAVRQLYGAKDVVPTVSSGVARTADLAAGRTG